MFGYVRPVRAELRVRDFELYKGVYCGLCREMGRRYGPLARLTLSYDFAFLAILSMAVSKDCAGFQKARCPFNPFKKKTCLKRNESVILSASAAMIMLHYKLLDNIEDGGFFVRLGCRLARPFVRRAREKAGRLYPQMDEAIARSIGRQRQVEALPDTGIDRAAEPTAQALAAICATLQTDEGQKRVLDRFGYMLGRWIYLMDAADDLADDLRSGNFNPFLPGDRSDVTEAQLADIGDEAAQSIDRTAAELARAYHLLDLYAFRDILDNVLYLGLGAAARQIFGRSSEATEKERA